MDRALRLTEFWNWLPTFRVVAETEHLPTAARHLHVSPSALSRTIHLLEENLGQRLFTREGRNIRLNPAGEEFLAAVRDAMRLIHEGLTHVEEAQLSGPLHISSVGFCNAMMPAVADDLQKDHPNVVVYLHHYPSSPINGMLLRGQLDVAFMPDPMAESGLSVEKVGTATNGIYCGRTHQLFHVPRPSRERVVLETFAAPIAAEIGLRPDGWPVELERRVSIYIQQLHLAVATCARGRILAVLPDYVARTYTAHGSLRRLPLDMIPPTPFYAVRRRRLVERDAADVVIGLVKEYAQYAEVPQAKRVNTGRGSGRPRRRRADS